MTGARARTSIAGRLTLLLGLVALTVFGAVGALLHWSLERELLRAERIELEGKADVVQHYIDEVQKPDDLLDLRHHLDDALIGNGTLRVWIIDAEGRALYGGAGAPSIRVLASGALSIVREDGVVLMGLRYVLRPGSAIPSATVLIGIDTRPRQALMRAHDQTTILVCALGVVATIGLSGLIARRGLDPLHRLSAEAAGIDAGALSQRLSTRSDSRELVPLVNSFNHALDRLEEAYRRLEGFSADVAHELRTPLAILISGTEVALSGDRPVAELQEVLVSNLEELRALASMVNDMLFLARADRGELAENLVPVSLRSEALAVADYLEASLEERGTRLRVEGDVQARVNPPLLRRALVNLVTNAARYTPTGEVIVVRLDEADESPRVSVSNTSPPIPMETLRRMFDRFWRGDPTRAEASDGHGLGLAIVRAVALMHGGETFAVSTSGTTTVGFTVGSGKC